MNSEGRLVSYDGLGTTVGNNNINNNVTFINNIVYSKLKVSVGINSPVSFSSSHIDI
jgi:hypothetical protein